MRGSSWNWLEHDTGPWKWAPNSSCLGSVTWLSPQPNNVKQRTATYSAQRCKLLLLLLLLRLLLLLLRSLLMSPIRNRTATPEHDAQVITVLQ